MSSLRNLRFRPDVVVVGGGLSGIATVEALLRLDPEVRVLLLERGPWVLKDHAQASGYGREVLGALASAPAEVHGRTGITGAIRAVGGGSLVWSGWSPRPTEEDIEAWPQPIADALTERLLDQSLRDLHVHQDSADYPLDSLGAEVYQVLRSSSSLRDCDIYNAPIAQRQPGVAFSPVTHLVSAVEADQVRRNQARSSRLQVISRCGAVAFDGGSVITDIGTLHLSAEATVVLSAGTMPNAQLGAAGGLLGSSVPLRGHFHSSIVVRAESWAYRNSFDWCAFHIQRRWRGQLMHAQVRVGAGPSPRGGLQEIVPGLPDRRLFSGCGPRALMAYITVVGEAGDLTTPAAELVSLGADPVTDETPQLKFVGDPRLDPMWDAMDDLADQVALALGGRSGTFSGRLGSQFGKRIPDREWFSEHGGRRWPSLVAPSGSTASLLTTAGTGPVRFAGMSCFPRAGSHNGGVLAWATGLVAARQIVGGS